ncbi:hypothetical protein ACFYXX_03615 [Streptomyces sp. NPDC002458]|uniref:hypothetical protein n=1 Tax=Streptomyces sp. NPDC002458 TaxID=3364644 RepID=UPI0036B56528
MRSPARLVTGTAAAALTAAALGLAIPSAHADSLGRPELTATAECGADGTQSLGGLDLAEDPAAVTEPAWPDSEAPEDEAGADIGDEAGTLRQPGTGTGTDPGARPEPPGGTAPGTDPGSAKPPVPPGHRPTASPSPSRPSGHVGTGVGGSAAPDTAQLAAGAGLVAAAALSGALLLRRRRTDGPRH